MQTYVRLLEAIARAIGEDPDEVIIRAFERTKFAASSAPGPLNANDELAFWFTKVSDAVIAAEDLQTYFEDARSVNAKYDPMTGDIFQAQSPLLSGWASPNEAGGFLEEAEVAWNPLPFPSVPLLRVKRHVFTGPILISKRPILSADTSVEEAARVCSPTRSSNWQHHVLWLKECELIDAEIRLSSELRFVIGPRHHANDIGSMFQWSTHVELRTNQCDRPLTFFHSMIPLSASDVNGAEVNDYIGSVAARFDDGWHLVSGVGKAGWTSILEIEPDYGVTLDSDVTIEKITGSSGYDFTIGWSPIDRQTLGRFMTEFSEGQYLVSLDGPDPRPTEIWLTSCPLLQISLYTGAFTVALRSSCQRLKAKLAAFVDQARRTRERESAELLARLESMSKFRP